MKIIFARTRYNYDSYTDYWDLVDLSGFHRCFLDEIDFQDPDAIYIVSPLNGEKVHLQNNASGRKCHIVWWYLERPDSGGEPINVSLDDALRYMDVVWCSDKFIAGMDSRFQFVALGGHAGLRRHGIEEKVYDYTHQSYEWGRRGNIFNDLRKSGRSEGPACWGEQRARVLAQSRLMLHVHQYDKPIAAPLRYALAAAYSLPIVTESVSQDPWPLYSSDLIQCGYYDLVPTVQNAHRFDLVELGNRIHQRYCVDLTFRHGVEDGIRDTFGVRLQSVSES